MSLYNDPQFLERQRSRIQRRLDAARRTIGGKRLDAALKAQHVLPALNRAMLAIESGTYGICCDCGGNISRKRLLHTPGSIRCVKCQTEHEL